MNRWKSCTCGAMMIFALSVWRCRRAYPIGDQYFSESCRGVEVSEHGRYRPVLAQ